MERLTCVLTAKEEFPGQTKEKASVGRGNSMDRVYNSKVCSRTLSLGTEMREDGVSWEEWLGKDLNAMCCTTENLSGPCPWFF